MPSINYKVTIIKHHLSPSLMSYSEERIKRIKTGFGSCWFEPCEPHVVLKLVCLTGISFLLNKICIYVAIKRFLELIVCLWIHWNNNFNRKKMSYSWTRTKLHFCEVILMINKYFWTTKIFIIPCNSGRHWLPIFCLP